MGKTMKNVPLCVDLLWQPDIKPLLMACITCGQCTMLLFLVNLCGIIMQAFPLFAFMDCVKRMITVEENGGAITTQAEQFH